MDRVNHLITRDNHLTIITIKDILLIAKGNHLIAKGSHLIVKESHLIAKGNHLVVKANLRIISFKPLIIKGIIKVTKDIIVESIKGIIATTKVIMDIIVRAIIVGDILLIRGITEGIAFIMGIPFIVGTLVVGSTCLTLASFEDFMLYLKDLFIFYRQNKIRIKLILHLLIFRCRR